MKNFRLAVIAAATCALAVSCEKPQSEAERNAQVEREVQQRLATEHQADEQRRLAQQAADLSEREQALAAKESAGTERSRIAAATPRPTQRPAVRDEETETRSTASHSNATPRSYDTFYRKLEPYGAWRETGDYGYVWQPQQAQRSRDWRPYTDGRWAYTDAGWTWISDEPFGWATYHYGRWTRLRDVGWVWVPGEEWAPAWVSWRSGDKNVGWAPLPPEARFERRTGIHKWADSYYDIDADEYVFIPNEDIGAQNVRRAVIPAQQNIAIVNQTTNVTNITYNNTTIVNEGPNYDQLRSHSREPLERMRIEREYNVRDEQAPQATVRGGVVAMVTPLFTAQATERPRNVGAPIRETAVERNWASSGNQAEAERTRAKMRAEATPPPDAPSKRFDRPAIAAATATPVASVAPAATATPIATATPVAAPTPTPVTALDATNAATATPRPTRSWSPSPAAQPTVTATATASATPTVHASTAPTAAPTATAPLTPRPAATPVATATPHVTVPPVEKPAATPSIRSTPPVDRVKPVIPPVPTPADPAAEKALEEKPLNNPRLGGQQLREAAAAEQKRQRDEARAHARPANVPPAATPAAAAETTPAAAQSLPPARAPRPAFTPRPDLPAPVITPDERAEPAVAPERKRPTMPPTPRHEAPPAIAPAPEAKPAVPPAAEAPAAKTAPVPPGRKPLRPPHPADDAGAAEAPTPTPEK